MSMIEQGGSWSGHERNCCFLNTGQTKFANASSVSGLDFPDDGRCVAPVDWDHDGDLDLWLSARTGPTLRLMRNNGSDKNHFVAFRLQGKTCNRDAIGARVEITVGGKKLLRTLHACDGYLSQAGKSIHFGTGEHSDITSVFVRWPGGQTEEFTGAASDGIYVLHQTSGKAEPWTPPKRNVSLKATTLPTVKSARASRIVLRDRVPAPKLTYKTFDGETAEVSDHVGHPVLVSLWASWCAPCLVELKEFSERADELREHGLEIVAINVEAVGENSQEAIERAQKMTEGDFKFPFSSGLAAPELLEKLDAAQEVVQSLRAASGQLPSSFLLDRFGRLAFIYQGRLTTEQLVSDVTMLNNSNPLTDASLPFPGRWINESERTGTLLVSLSGEMKKRGLTEEALRYGSLASDIMSRHNVDEDDRLELASLFFETGFERLQKDDFSNAARYFRESVRMRPDWAEAHVNLGTALQQLNRDEQALTHLQLAIRSNPELLQAHFGLGHVYLKLNRLPQSAEHFQAAIQIAPNFAEGHHQLGIVLARLGYGPQAMTHLRRAVQLDSGNQAAQRSLQQMLGGQKP